MHHARCKWTDLPLNLKVPKNIIYASPVGFFFDILVLKTSHECFYNLQKTYNFTTLISQMHEIELRDDRLCVFPAFDRIFRAFCFHSVGIAIVITSSWAESHDHRE